MLTRIDPFHKIPTTLIYNYFVVFTVSLGGFLYGADIGTMDALLRMDAFGLQFGLLKMDPTNSTLVPTEFAAETAGWITSSFLMGCVAGAIVVSFMADNIGRKWSILIGASFYCIGGGLQAVLSSINSMIYSRVCAGLGVGILSMSVPMYISETAPSEIRGRLVSIVQLMTGTGYFLSVCVNSLLFLFTTGDRQWRLSLTLKIIPGLLLLVLGPFVPYSPRWLVNHGRDADAIRTISKLRGSECNAANVIEEYTEIKKGIIIEQNNGKSGWLELLSKQVRIRVLTALLLSFFQQWTGISVILYYAGDLFERIGFSDSLQSISFITANAFITFIANFPGIYLIERIGRKKLLVIGGFLMGASHLGITLFVGLSTNHHCFAWLAVFSVYFFIFVFYSTWGPVVWVYQSEIFPLRVRAKAIGLATVTNWTWNAIVTKVAPLLVRAIGFYTYVIFGIMSFLMTAFSVIFLPETKGKSLEEMDQIFGTYRTNDIKV